MSMKANLAGERALSWGWGAAALGAALSLGGCSAVVSDLGGIEPDPEGCIQEPGRRGGTRDLAMVFRQMQPHGSQKTVATVIRRRTGMIQARAIIMPTGAGALGPRRLVREDRPDTTDGLRCRLASGDGLDVLVRVPQMLPPDATNEGPYQLDFWSDLNRTGGTVQPFPEDHSWSANVCDNGVLLFEHNTGFETLADAPGGGAFRATFAPDVIGPAFARASPRVMALDPVRDAMARQALIDATMSRLAELPLVITVERQGLTVGYLRTEMECLVPAASGPDVGRVTLAIPGVIDGGNFHDVQAYFDTQRNGRFDMECDPSCRVTLEQSSPDGNLVYDLSPGAACSFPDGFHQGSPGETCAIIEAPTVEEFLADGSAAPMIAP